jgi:hypothetical protein
MRAAAVSEYQTPEESDPYVRFSMEAYDTILDNFWMEREKYDISELFRLSVEKATNAPAVVSTTTRAGTATMLASAFSTATTSAAKKELATTIVNVVLYNLQPIGRNGLLSTQQVKELRQEVSNINPGKDLYQDIGVAKGASVAAVEQSYQAEAAKLAAATSSQDLAKLEKLEYAREVLTNENNKELYDEMQVEPTMFTKAIGKTLYINFTQVSPTSLQEFVYTIDHSSTTPGVDSLILDMRGNIGGSLDFFQHFFGFFIGENQYAFDLYHQGAYQPQRTIQPEFPQLSRFKEIAILTDEMTQSTAELTAAAFKHFNLAKVVGTTTRGWGTVENTYPLKTTMDDNTTYALLLVNSLTLRDDNQPIETRGVDPDIRTADTNWRSQLGEHFRSSSVIQAVRAVMQGAPLRK